MKKTLFKGLNWEGFWFMLLIASLGLLSNKTVNDLETFIFGLIVAGVPLGLIIAFIGKDDE